MKERVNKLRTTLKLTMEKFGVELGVGKTAISKIEKGENALTDQMIKAICNINWNGHYVNEDWLRYNKGEMFKPSPSSELEALANKYNLSDETKTFIEEFISLKPEYQGAVIQFIVNLADKLKDNEHAATTEPENSDSVAAAEALYERSLGIVPKTKSTALNTTEETEETNNKVYKISNQ